MRGLFPVLPNPTPRSPSKPQWKRDNAWSLGKEPWVGSSSVPLQRPTPSQSSEQWVTAFAHSESVCLWEEEGRERSVLEEAQNP